MGQYLSDINSQIVDSTKSDRSTPSSTAIASRIDPEDVNLFLPTKILSGPTNSKTQWIKHIQNNLFLLTNVPELKLISTEIDKVIMEDIFISIVTDYKREIQEIKDILVKQEQLKRSLTIKLEEDKKWIDTQNSGLQQHRKVSLEENLSTVIQHFIFEWEKDDRMTERQIEKILSNFSPTTTSLKDILPVLNQLIFDTVNVYDARNVLVELNNKFERVRHQYTHILSKQSTGEISLNYLTSIGAFPNKSLRKLHKKQFTGQFTSVVIFTHIDFDNIINASKQLKAGSINSSMSFEFHPYIFKQLFHIIEQLTTTKNLNANLVHILSICLRLFTTHLTVLCEMTTNLHRDLLLTNESIKRTIEIPVPESNKEIKLSDFATDDELRIWLDTLLILACNDEQTTNCREASKAIIHVLDKKATSFIDKLSFIHKYIVENKNPALIEQLLIELNTNTTMLSWIEVLCDKDNEKREETRAVSNLYVLIDIYLNPSSDWRTQHTEQILRKFHQLVFARLVASEMGSTASSLTIKYLTYILRNSNGKLTMVNDIFVGLYVMTETEKQFNFAMVQPIFIAVLPLLADFVLQNTSNQEISYWILGKISQVLINASPQDPLEMKIIEKLQSPLFAGGYEGTVIENNQYLSDLFQSNLAVYSQFKVTDYNQQSPSDDEFLMSIYHNTGQGAQLISKMKLHIKDKRCLLQKSIEQQANDACATLFAVYIKHYRRINLANSELSRPIDHKPHQKLLSIFEYANRIQALFARTKGHGGDCDQLYEQIKIKTQFLLSSVKESNLIPIIEDTPDGSNDQHKGFRFKRQYSRRKIEKHTFRILRNMFQACIRFKKLMLAKKNAIEQKQDNEIILHRAIDLYVHQGLASEANQLIQCMTRQYERGMTRLLTYRFIHTFIQKLIQTKDQNQIMTFLKIYLPHLRNPNIDWSYLENISSINFRVKDEIRNRYYSIILSYLLQLTTTNQTNLFNLLNLSYTSEDIHYLHDYDFLGLLFTRFVSSLERSDQPISPDMKLIGYNWFRLYVMKLCENFEIEQVKETIPSVFQKLILNELKGLKQLNDTSSIINQWLKLLLQCLCSYEQVQSLCGTLDYMEELLDIYRNNQNQMTVLFTLKILRKLILFLPNSTDGKLSDVMNTFLNDILIAIGDSFSSQRTRPDIVNELIYIYRTIVSSKSAWQMMATQIIVDTIISGEESMESKQMSNVLASLAVLGGYIHPFCLHSVVQIDIGDEINNETQLAVIIEIDTKARDSGTADARPYFVQYVETNRTEWVNSDRLRIEIDVPSPDLLTLPNAYETIHSLFDALAYFLQIDTSKIESLPLLQLKRRSIAALYRLLSNKKLVDIFMQKPYASIIAKLSISGLLSKNYQPLADLYLPNKRHLEQYCLSLDRCEPSKQIIDDKNVTSKDESSFTVWTKVPLQRNRLSVDFLSVNTAECYEWKPNASKRDIELFKRGRIGNDEITIVPMPRELARQLLIEECGTMHSFPGRAYFISEGTTASMDTFVVDNLQLSEGKWYYCVRLLGETSAQIGWATTGFNPTNTVGIGNDKYSWSYDGSQGMLYNNGQHPFLSESVRWFSNDVCGCGIEIDGDQTRINYWLNGQFLGTAFVHQLPISSTTSICDMLPNECSTTYFPGVSLKLNVGSSLTCCEFIFSPEDMFECPLPKGYKPLLIPKVVNIDNSLVSYPYSAYLAGDNVQDYIHRTRCDNSVTFLRDFVKDHHLKTTFNCDNHQLILSELSDGLPLTIDHHEEMTISFDFQLLTKTEKLDIVLLTFDTPETFSIRIPLSKIHGETAIAIVFNPNDRQTKIYINNEFRTFESPAITQSIVHILPAMAVGVRNLAIWKYALSEEHIRRLFTFGLSYVAIDYHRLSEYRKQANIFTFTGDQKNFINGLLVPFNEPFDENKWQKKQQAVDQDESRYFKAIKETDQSTIQLLGNRTYLVLDKSIDQWSEYTLILDISIDHLPRKDEHVSLVIFNSQTEIFITHDGRLCLSVANGTNICSESILKSNEYVRLLISVQEKSISIYVNGLLALNTKLDDDQLTIKDKRIDLFRERNLENNNDDENTLRIECKSITYLNRAITALDEQMKSPNHSLESLVAFPYSIIAPSLILIGYDEASIKSAMHQNPTANIQFLDTILRGTNVNHHTNILSKLGSSIDKEKLKDLLEFSEFDTDEKFATLAKIMLIHWNDIHTLSPPSIDKNWFHQSFHHLNINQRLTEWIRDKSTTIEETDLTHQLLDLNQPIQGQTTGIKTSEIRLEKSIQYSHHQITSQQYYDSRIACEYELIAMYSHYTILNMLRVWSNDGSNLFPLEKFSDCTLIVTLMRLLDYHYNYTRLHSDENIDRMSLLINSILKVETYELLKHHKMSYEQIMKDILPYKAPILYQLQKGVIVQAIQFLLNPSLLNDESIIVEKQSIMKPNFHFILKLVNLFVKLVSDKSIIKQHEIDYLLPILFPESLVNLLFDLLLISPMHQSKIVILHLFSTLMQASNRFNLNGHIQQFLCHLFVELSPNPTSMSTRTMKLFHIALMDLVFLLFQRNQTTERFEFDFSRFSQSFHDLLMVIDVLNALTDKTKHTPFPEQFLLQSIALLGNDLRITREDIEKSHSYFDTTADLQLFSFANNNPLINISLTTFINSLPTQSTPDPIYYKIYPSLWHIPVNCIQTRAKLLCLFSMLIEKLISVINLSLSPGQSILTDKIGTGRAYILYPTKSQLFSTSLTITKLEPDGNIPTVNFDTVGASTTDNHGLHTMFNQAYEQLHDNAHLTFRKSSDQLWLAQYLAMHSTDHGGPYRDSISCMCFDICSTRLTLFILCPNGRTNSGLNRDRWIPNVFPPNQPLPNRVKKQYRFIGQLMGMAVRQKHYLDLKFPILLWKQLVREQVTLEDIEAIDIQSFTLINEVKKMIEQNHQSIDNDSDINDLLSSIFDELRFEVVSSAGQTYELVPGGGKIPITATNVKDYCTSCREYRLNEFHRQIELIRQGLYSVVPGYFLSMFTAGELEEAVCGKGEMDMELLKRNTEYGDPYNQGSLVIQQFWTILTNMFNEEQKKLFLKFVWGRCTLPSCDDDFTTSFKIDPYDVDNRSIDGALPRSHTCTFVLDLPHYSTVDIMYDRLNYAITYCSSIDGDGNMNETPAPSDYDSDWSTDE